jgi:GR25 family glycosyltransferase involved in LPS biosynthesis/tetratricopeptide (TPR) repeat protein
MIVKNESHLIVDTLKHLDKYIQFDYWAINDNGSTDGTQKLIQDYFAEKGIPGILDTTPWKDFAFNRTAAFNAAYNKTDYVFVWDADDEIAGDFKMPSNLTEDSYKFIFGSGDDFRYSRCQLFNNRKRWCYRGVLHEYAECLEPVKPTCDIIGDYYFISGRKGDRSRDPDKYLKDALVLRREIDKPDAEKDPLYNRNVFYCAQSYNSCGKKAESIEFYKKTTTLQTWPQEKYVSCFEIYDQYEQLGKPEEGFRYLVESYKYDPTRIECMYRLIKYYCVAGPVEVSYAYYTLIQDFYENKYNPAFLGDKLFAKMGEYHFFLPYFMIIVAQRVNRIDTVGKMVEMVVKLGYVAPEWFMRNIMFNIQFAIPSLPKTIEFLQKLLVYVDMSRLQGVRYEPAQLQVLGRVIDSFRPALSARPALELMPSQKSPVRVMLTITTCKRFDLFEQTVGSLLNTWTDLGKVDYFFCVDDNSTQRDRSKMKAAFPFFDYYMKRKAEKGHRASMNIIYEKLKEVKPQYWIHMEDDWLFFQKDSYVQKSIDFLEKYETRDIHQILYNRHYGETYDCWDTNGGELLEPGYLVHLKSDNIPGRNCGYWPHYSFRPSMVRVKTIMELGNYDSPNTFFERDYADKYFAKGYKSAFLNTICSIHIGKLTSDKTGTNAYTLNQMGQFGANQANNVKGQSAYVVNLLRRTDRKEAVEVAMDAAGVKDGEYEFFEAIDGKELVLTDDIGKLFMGNDFGSRRGVIGCALSHYTLWKQLVADTTNEYYTIFEDDITLVDGFKEKWESAKGMSEADMVFLGYHVREENKSTITAVPKNPSEDKIPLDKDVYIGGFYGYIVTKKGAKKLLDYISQNGIRHGIDYLVKIIPDFVSYNCQPHIVLSEWVKSTSSSVDTDIQKDFTSLDINSVIKVNKDDWVFYEGLDSGGGDMGRSDPKTGIDSLMAVAQSKPGCVAFNTLGFLKSHVRFPLIKSPWLQAPNGIYVKKAYKPSTRVKMLCNWCSSEDLCKEWLKMSKGSYKWNDIEITWSDDNIDYYVIINKPRPEDIEQKKFKPEKTIIFHMEPWCGDSSQGWGVKTWGEWAKPDPAKFLQVRSHDKFLNTGFWQVSWTYTDFKTKTIEKSAGLGDVVSSICSSKYFDPGHKKRIDFLKYIESRSSGSNDPVKLHIYNEDNQHGFVSYKGKAQPSVDKEKGLMPYKYYFMCENNAEANFVTEKLWEPILCEALCFYWGCPNVTEHVDPRAYVVLDMNDFEAAYNTMNAAIKMNLWEERLPYIKAAKQRILDEQSFFPLLEQALKPKTVCFIHSCNLPEVGTEKLDLLLESVCAVKELECITINNIGVPLDLMKYEYMDTRIKVIEASCDTDLFELPTLKLISEYSKANPNAKVLYVHTKGISYAKEDPRYINGLDWINYMLHFVCKRVDRCLKLLDTHDVAGCNFSEQPYHHFSGNFWWATSAHLKGLSLESLVDKMSAEWWLMNEYNTRPMRVANLWSSGKNHFTERYPVEEYNNSQASFHILIACGGRKTLKSLLDSVIGQLNKFDAITIVFDGENARVNSGYSNSWITGCESSIFTIDQTPNLGANIGSEPVRNKYQSQLEKITSFVVHADDDDIYLPGAFDKLREQCTDTDTLYIAKFDNADNLNNIVPRCNKIEYCNIGTPCGIIPYTYRDLATWGNHRGGDYAYYNSLQHKVKNVVWLDTIIYRVMSIGHGIIKD